MTYTELCNLVFIAPAVIGALANIVYLAYVTGGRRDQSTATYAFWSIVPWAAAVVTLTVRSWMYHTGSFPLLGSPLQVPIVTPVFAFIGVVGYACYSIGDHYRTITGRGSEIVRRKILVAIANRVTLAPYLAVVLVLLADFDSPAMQLFAGLFTGLWIKVVLSLLDEAGRKFLPARLQQALTDRENGKEDEAPNDDVNITRDASKLLPQAWDQLKTLPGVVGLSVGSKTAKGKGTGDIAIVVKVKQKQSDIPIRERVPPELTLRSTDGQTVRVLTDVIEVGTPTANHHATANLAPQNEVVVGAGSQIANAADRDNYGTVSCFVNDMISGKRVLLSAYHALKHPSDPFSGVENPGRQGDMVDDDANEVGTLLRGTRSSVVDAAIAELAEGVTPSPSIPTLGLPGPADSVWAADINRREVFLYGAYSGPSPGKVLIREIDAIARVDYGNVVHEMFGLIAIDRCTFGGDSGALVLDRNRRSIGLVLGSDDVFTYVIPIQTVLHALNIQLP